MSAESRGVVVAFDDERGFGFIRSPGFSEDVFVHASAVLGGERLKAGHRVRFVAEGSDRGPRAVRVRPGRRGLPPDLGAAVLLLGVVATTTIGLGLAGAAWSAAWLVPINLATLAAWAWDKHRAVRDGRRVPELALLGLAAIGGTIGALAGVAALRHKRRKAGFLAVLGGIAVGQVVALAALLTRS